MRGRRSLVGISGNPRAAGTPKLSGSFPERQRERKRRAFAGLARGRPDATAMVFDDLLADREAKAGAVGFAVRGERLEQRLRDLRSDAATGVLHLDAQLRPIDDEAQEDFSTV